MSRNVYMVGGGTLVLMILFLTDPDTLKYNLPFGASTIAQLITLAQVVLLVVVAHWSRNAMLPYVRAYELYIKAKQTPEGAGMYFIGVSLHAIAIAILIFAAYK